MNLTDLLACTTPIDGGQERVVRSDTMLTMLDPSGRNNQQHPIELVSMEDDCVVISLVNVEDAVWYDAASFDEDIQVWKKAS